MTAPLARAFAAAAWTDRFLAVVGEHGETDVHDLVDRRIVRQKRPWPLFTLLRSSQPGAQAVVHLSSDGRTLHAVGWRGEVSRSAADVQAWTAFLKPPAEGYGAMAVDERSGAVALALQRFPIHAAQPSWLVVERSGTRAQASLGPRCQVEAIAFVGGALHLVRVVEGQRPAVIERWADDLSGAERLGEIPGGEAFVAARVTIFPGGRIAFHGARHRTNPYAVEAGVSGVCDLRGTPAWIAACPPVKNPDPRYGGERFGMFFDDADLGLAADGALFVPRHFGARGFTPVLERRRGPSPDAEAVMGLPGVQRLSISPDGRRALVAEEDPERTRVISLADGAVEYWLDPLVLARERKRAALSSSRRRAMPVPESFHDELLRLQGTSGPDRVKRLVAHLRTRSDEPWPAWARALEIFEARMEKIVADVAAGRKPDARGVGADDLGDVAAALQAHYAKAEAAGMRAGLSLDGRFELATRSRLAAVPTDFFDWAALRDFQRLRFDSDPLSFERSRFTPAARALARSPHVRWTAALAFSGTGLDPEAAEALAASATLVSLDSLSFHWEGLGGRGVAALVSSPIAKRLRFATFDFCIAGDPQDQDAAIEALRAPAFAGSLRRLSLRGNGFEARHVRALVACGWLSALTSLDLGMAEGENPIGDEGALALAGCAGLAGLERLGLSGCGITDTGARALLDSPHLARCVFDFEGDDLSEEILEAALARGTP